ncbi:capsular exopolysaccharide family [Tessaracoccus bendigoensis DSM 12906]|uniref:Capsular exopolysaccharide family n=1 Tax=Tessaracoccus bendigoensis DSM 12906 TaxID=1123357 RepID=A0A1M6K628_9ACTN|nr:capsular exopolysaccharide family [Tessaracoccus bendigoensis DSM 12906]
MAIARRKPRTGRDILDLVQLWALARRNWLTLLLATILGVAVGAGISYLQPTLYSATSVGYVVVGNSSTENAGARNPAAEKAATYLPLAESRSVAETVAQELGVQSGEVSLDAKNDGVIFEITAQAPTAEGARLMADAGIRATSVAANELETMTVTGEPTDQLVVKIAPVEPALTPSRPTSPNWARNLALGLALGLLCGFGAVVLRRSLDRRVRQADEVEELTSATALGVVPTAVELASGVSLVNDSGTAAEALRQLRTNLRFVSVDTPVRSIVVTSPSQGEGKSTIAMQLAALLAESGEPTVLIDADLRRPRVAQLFGIDGAVGLTQVVAGSLTVADALVSTSQPNLSVLPAGRIPPNPSEIVGSKRMADLIAHLSETHLVIIDAAPLLPVADAGLVSAVSDGVLLVVQHGKTLREQIALATRNLDNVDAALLGFVMNQVPKKDLGAAAFGYGYSGASPRYYYAEDDGRRRPAAEVSGARQGRGRSQSTPRPRRVAADDQRVEVVDASADAVVMEPASTQL